MLTPLPIPYAFRPRVRGRLTRRGRTFRRKPRAFGEEDSHLLYRYWRPDSHFPAVQRPSRDAFTPLGTLPYRRQRHEDADDPRLRWWA